MSIPESEARSAAQVREAERRVFEWSATASIGAKLAYWTDRAKELSRAGRV